MLKDSTIFLKIYELIAAVLFAISLIVSTRHSLNTWQFWLWFIIALIFAYAIITLESGRRHIEAMEYYDKKFDEMREKIKKLESKLKGYEK